MVLFLQDGRGSHRLRGHQACLSFEFELHYVMLTRLILELLQLRPQLLDSFHEHVSCLLGLLRLLLVRRPQLVNQLLISCAALAVSWILDFDFV